MLQILIRILLLPITVLGDILGLFSMSLLWVLIAQERGLIETKFKTKEPGFFYTKSLLEKPWFKNK